MTDVDTLRRAAARMRERARSATPGAWDAFVLGSEGYDIRAERPRDFADRRLSRVRVARCGMESWDTDKANAAHIASWSPPVAVDAADLLDEIASTVEQAEEEGVSWARWDFVHRALDVARTYLGGDSAWTG